MYTSSHSWSAWISDERKTIPANMSDTKVIRREMDTGRCRESSGQREQRFFIPFMMCCPKMRVVNFATKCSNMRWLCYNIHRCKWSLMWTTAADFLWYWLLIRSGKNSLVKERADALSQFPRLYSYRVVLCRANRLLSLQLQCHLTFFGLCSSAQAIDHPWRCMSFLNLPFATGRWPLWFPMFRLLSYESLRSNFLLVRFLKYLGPGPS